MSPPRTDTDAFALGNAYYAECTVVYEFMGKQVLPIVQRHVAERDPHKVISSGFYRALYWLSTMGKLNHPSDYQAATVGSRALFEMTVDLTLMVGDREKYPVTTLLVWEDSAKLKSAEDMVKRAAENKAFKVQEELVTFIARNGDVIRAQRAHLWSKGSHPLRWTGMNLRQDAHAADALGGQGLEDFYVSRHGQLCWATHGSGLTGARQLDSDIFPGLIVYAMKEAADFGMRCAKLSLQYLEAFDLVAEQRFAAAERERTRDRGLGYAQCKHPSDG